MKLDKALENVRIWTEEFKVNQQGIGEAVIQTNGTIQRVQGVQIAGVPVPNVQSVTVEHEIGAPPVVVLRCVVGAVRYEAHEAG